MAQLHRPAPILHADCEPISRRVRFRDAAARLRRGETLWVRDHYGTGVSIIEALVARLRPPLATASHQDKQAYREAYRETAWRLLAPIEAGRVALPGAPEIGFLGELYPELERFWLPFPEVRDLANAWARYDRGVPMPVLGYPLHPFYGAYLPKRTLHLELFATWMSRWKGARQRAFDVGTGSGVLALMLAKAGFASVLATDINPNAIESVRREVARHEVGDQVAVARTDLLAGIKGEADLIVFNPPWTLGPVDNLLDRALNYEGDLFERFFDQALTHLAPGGRVVIVFSNVIRLVQPDVPHPIDAELARGRFRLVELMKRKVKPPPGTKGPVRRTKERVEVWELEVAS